MIETMIWQHASLISYTFLAYWKDLWKIFWL